MRKIKYTIGITGSRYLPPNCLFELTAEVRKFYREKAAVHGAANITVLSSIAEGADTLCAKLALDEGFRLILPLPMPAMEYRKDFPESAAAEYDKLLSLADEVFTAPPDEQPSESSKRGFWYRQAGLYIVKHSEILLAIWDGVEKDTPDGAGTWETVKAARKSGKPIHYVSI